MTNLKLMTAWILTATVLIFSGCSRIGEKRGEDVKEQIEIGVVYPLTGDAAFWGNNAKNGAELAVEDFTKENEGKYEVSVIYEDSKSSSKDAISAVNKLIFQDDVKFIAGDLVSSNLLAIAPICQQNKIVTIGQGSNPKIKSAGDYIFRTWPSDDLQGRALAKFMVDGLKPIKPSLLFVNNEYGNGVSEVLQSSYPDEFAFIDKYDPKQKDFRNIILKIPNDSDALILIAYPEELPIILSQISEYRKNIPVIGTETFENEKIKTLKTEYTIYYTLPVFADSSSQIYKSFAKSYHDKFGKQVGVPAAPAYDGMMLLLKGIKKEGYNPDKVKKYLLGMKNYKGVSGSISFDENGDVLKDFLIKSLENGEEREIMKINL